MDWSGQYSTKHSLKLACHKSFFPDMQAKARHAHLDNKLKELHAVGNGPQFSDLSRLHSSEQGRAGLSVVFMDLLLTTDYAVQDEQEDIEVWHSAHFPLSAHAHTRTVLCCAVLCFPTALTTPDSTIPRGSWSVHHVLVIKSSTPSSQIAVMHFWSNIQI